MISNEMSFRVGLQQSLPVRSLLLLATIALGPASAPVLAQVPDEVILQESTYDSGTRSEFAVSKARLCGTTPWRPETDALPLTIAAAVQAAKKGLGNSQSKWIVVAVALNASGCESEFRWYYTIEMYDEARANSALPPPIIDRIVLMDGLVVSPRLSAK